MEFNLLYVNDICTLFFLEFTEIKDLMMVNLLSKYHNLLVKKFHWNIIISVYNDITLDYILDNYNFINLIIGMHCDVNKFALRLGKCQSLNLCKTNINDESIKIILSYGKCCKWNLSETKITNNCIQSFNSFKMPHFVNFSGTEINKIISDTNTYLFEENKRLIEFKNSKWTIISEHNGFDTCHSKREYANYLNDIFRLGLISEDEIDLAGNIINILTLGEIKNEYVDDYKNVLAYIINMSDTDYRHLTHFFKLPIMIDGFEEKNSLLFEKKYPDFGICCDQSINLETFSKENNVLTLNYPMDRWCDFIKYIKIDFGIEHPINFKISIIYQDREFSQEISAENNPVIIPTYFNLIGAKYSESKLKIEFNKILNHEEIIVKFGNIYLNRAMRRYLDSSSDLFCGKNNFI